MLSFNYDFFGKNYWFFLEIWYNTSNHWKVVEMLIKSVLKVDYYLDFTTFVCYEIKINQFFFKTLLIFRRPSDKILAEKKIR